MSRPEFPGRLGPRAPGGVLYLATSGTPQDDFVSSGVYTISGTIVDGAAAGIEGVTVALTGDATDSTTTAADGTYSFAGVVDGSYTVTPTLANLKMTPASRAAVVSGADVALDNIVGQYLLLPYTYNMSDVAPSSGAVTTQFDDWYLSLDGLADGSITTTVADSNSYTPPGVTKGFVVPWNGTRAWIGNLLPYAIDHSLESLRIAVLVKAAEANRTIAYELADQRRNTALNARFAIFNNTNSNPDQITTYAQYDSGTTYNELNTNSAGVDVECRRWHWVRLEYNFIDNKVRASVTLAETSASQWSLEANMNAAGQTLNHVPTGLQWMGLSTNLGSSTPTVAKFWIGTASDDWPV